MNSGLIATDGKTNFQGVVSRKVLGGLRWCLASQPDTEVPSRVLYKSPKGPGEKGLVGASDQVDHFVGTSRFSLAFSSRAIK